MMLLLSLRAGLRACEIAGLDWSMVLDARGRIGRAIEIRDSIAKKGSGRRVPIHPELGRALPTLKRASSSTCGPIVVSARGGRLRANSVVNWFIALYRKTGIDGCSSHSGRRTFITLASRQAHRAGASLRDLQLLAGHRSIETTQRYIDGDSDAQRRLVSGLCPPRLSSSSTHERILHPMKSPLLPFPAVAVMLDQIDVAGPISFAGIDLDSGKRVRVLIEPVEGAVDCVPAGEPTEFPLLLTLSVQPVDLSRD